MQHYVEDEANVLLKVCAHLQKVQLLEFEVDFAKVLKDNFKNLLMWPKGNRIDGSKGFEVESHGEGRRGGR